MQIVFQDPYRSLNPRRSVGAAIIEGPMNYGAPRERGDRTRARELHGAGAHGRGRRSTAIRTSSPAASASASASRARSPCEPELLIADEAVSALDVSVQAQVLALLEEIRARLDLAMLFITHDLRVAAQVCDRVAVMQRGRVVEYGPAAEVFAAPQHEYTRALFAAAPGRRLEGR